MSRRRVAATVLLLLLPLGTACGSDGGGKIEAVGSDGAVVPAAGPAATAATTAAPAPIPASIVPLLGSYDCNNGSIVAGEGTFTIVFKDGDIGTVSGTWRVEGINDLVVVVDGAVLRGTIQVFHTTDAGSGTPLTRIELSVAGDDGQAVEMTMKVLTHTAYIDFTIDDPSMDDITIGGVTIDGSTQSWGCDKVL